MKINSLWVWSCLVGVIALTGPALLGVEAESPGGGRIAFVTDDIKEGIPLVSAVGGERAVYTDAAIAVIIDGVECDGVRLAPEGYGDGHDTKKASINIEADLVVYRLRYGLASYLVEEAESGRGLVPRLYFIPASKRSINVRYRIIFPSGRISKPMHVEVHVGTVEE